MTIAAQMRKIAQDAKAASLKLASAEGSVRQQALLNMAELLGQSAAAIFAANKKDLDAAQKSGLDSAKLDRLTISQGVLDSMIQGCREVAAMS
ncbi:MAG: gamma-glutamyl-phosphate reductase, partial [Humidesulfovibrio sp.]|nr:gamma-glutamyl-phosphate reductase [Humidesulfovibrio sp.]